MTNTHDRLLTAAWPWLKSMRSRYSVLALTLLILGLGVLVVLLVQPAPPTFAEGWSSPKGIGEVRLGELHRAVMDRQDDIHLVWSKQVNRKLVAFYARLDRHGQLIDGPVRLSDPETDAESVAVALTNDGAPLCFWIEKGRADASQRLMMARPETGGPPEVLSTSSKIMRDLAVTSDERGRIFLAWSDNRQGLYDIYMTAFGGEGDLSFNERRVTDSGRAFVFEPILAAGGDVVHLIYFSDQVVHEDLLHRTYEVTGEPLAGPQVLEQVSQVAVQLGGGETLQGYLLTAAVGTDSQLHLYESLGPLVRRRTLGKDARVVQPAEPLLMGSQYYSQVRLARQGEQQWLVWADVRWGSQDRFQVYAAALDSAGRVGKVTRLTYALSSALWPVMLLDSVGGRHLIWQQSAGPYTYEIKYINDQDPARISVWQRLGFTGDGGGWSLLVALTQSTVLAVITVILNVWRLAVTWGVTALVFLVARRIGAAAPYVKAVTWVVLLGALFVVVRPATETLGQLPIVVAAASHWAMGLVASALVLYLGRVWREEFHGILIWAGMAGLWLWFYYFLNLTLILREGFAV